MPHYFQPAILFIWSGLAIGGSMIAAPAKFQAQSLTLRVALDVGRAQFLWIGVGEAVLCAAFILSRIFLGGVAWKLALIPVFLLIVQRFVIMPPLDARTLQIIAGEEVGSSHLHIAFIVAEVAKIVFLIAIACISLNSESRN